MLYGTAMPLTQLEQHHPEHARRSVVGEITASIAGNVVLRVGRENEPGGTWSLSEHIVMTPEEALTFAEHVRTVAQAGAELREVLYGPIIRDLTGTTR